MEKSDWGPWHKGDDDHYLHMENGYAVDLDRCESSAAVLDWICQIAHKGWANDATLAGLVRALDDILDPQATLCSWGREVTPKDPGH